MGPLSVVLGILQAAPGMLDWVQQQYAMYTAGTLTEEQLTANYNIAALAVSHAIANWKAASATPTTNVAS